MSLISIPFQYICTDSRQDIKVEKKRKEFFFFFCYSFFLVKVIKNITYVNL